MQAPVKTLDQAIAELLAAIAITKTRARKALSEEYSSSERIGRDGKSPKSRRYSRSDVLRRPMDLGLKAKGKS